MILDKLFDSLGFNYFFWGWLWGFYGVFFSIVCCWIWGRIGGRVLLFLVFRILVYIYLFKDGSGVFIKE